MSVDAARNRQLRNQKERTCLFRDVCFDRRKGGWYYFAPADEFLSVRGFEAGVDIWARGDFGRASAISVDHRFAVRRGGVPKTAEFFRAPMLIKVAALAPANFGHFLGNAMFPAFEAAWRLFGARSLDMRYQLLLAGLNQSAQGSKMHARCVDWVRHEQGSRPGMVERKSPAETGDRGGRRRREQRQWRKQPVRQEEQRSKAASSPQQRHNTPRQQAQRQQARRQQQAAKHQGGEEPSPRRRLQEAATPATSAAVAASRPSSADAVVDGHRPAGRSAAALESAAQERCALHAHMVDKFASQLLPGLSDYPLLWEGSLGDARESDQSGEAARGTGGGAGNAGRWLCARKLVVGTGDFGFSTIHRLFNGSRRHPPKLLWSDFIRRIITRLDPSRDAEWNEDWLDDSGRDGSGSRRPPEATAPR